jgi:xanthine dehydrogenase accessory factor
MAAPDFDPTLEHPLDVLRAAVAFADAGKRVALAAVAVTLGGGVRAPGALMAISEDGDCGGYISGGCIDADVVVQSRAALTEGEPRRVRYGQGSPFLDLPLPCGGAIEVAIMPDPDFGEIRAAVDRLARRGAVGVFIGAAGRISLLRAGEGPHADGLVVAYRPKLRVRIAGRGADALALARVAIAAGCDTSLWSPDPHSLAAAGALGVTALEKLTTQSALPVNDDDASTAFALMAHDPDWEAVLLKDALLGAAFYVGAVGSRKTKDRRAAALLRLGCAQEQIDRVRGPIGLVPSLRDASLLAVSALAEIVSAWRESAA